MTCGFVDLLSSEINIGDVVKKMIDSGSDVKLKDRRFSPLPLLSNCSKPPKPSGLSSSCLDTEGASPSRVETWKLGCASLPLESNCGEVRYGLWTMEDPPARVFCVEVVCAEAEVEKLRAQLLARTRRAMLQV